MHSILRIGCTHLTISLYVTGNRDRQYSSAGCGCYRKRQRRQWGYTRGKEQAHLFCTGYSYFMFSFICTVKCRSLLLSQGNQKQRWLPGMDPVLPGHVLFLSPLPGLVWQLTQQARIDSIRQESVRLWHILVISLKGEDNTEMECTADHAGPGVRSNKVFLIKIIQVEVAVYSSLMLTIYFHV